MIILLWIPDGPIETVEYNHRLTRTINPGPPGASTTLPDMIDKLLLNIRALLRMEFIRYGISGVIAFVCDFGVLVAATELLGIHYLISNLMGYSVGLVVSYTLNIYFVFDHRRYDDSQHKEFIYFTTIVIVGLIISEGVVWLVTEFMELHYTWSKLISVVFVFLFNYVVKKRLLFSPVRE